MLTRIYGDGSVLNINQVMAEDGEVTESTKILSSQELQVKALALHAAVKRFHKMRDDVRNPVILPELRCIECLIA